MSADRMAVRYPRPFRTLSDACRLHSCPESASTAPSESAL